MRCLALDNFILEQFGTPLNKAYNFKLLICNNKYCLSRLFYISRYTNIIFLNGVHFK